MKRISFLAAAAVAGTGLTADAAYASYPKHRVSGVILSVNGSTIVMERRNGSTVSVDLSEAIANLRVGVIAPMIKMVVHGYYNADGTFHCVSTSHAGPALEEWTPDQ